MAVTIDEIQVKFGAEITELQKRLDTVEGEVKKTEKSTNNLNKAFKAAGAAIIAAFSVDTLIRFGRQVISVTAEFQRLEAQLTTALGSQSAAQRAMQDIVDFAARTPFQVTQLTEAFVGFANRGVKPSIARMENLGDLAAALGKDFDLLSGAIIDAVDPMRWRNLGIVVTREGDKMTGSFKGLQVTVDATTEGALEMAAAFGQMEGVAGGMARVSDTLGGKISNLQDNLDTMFNAIGQANNGVLVTFIDNLNTIVEALTRSAMGARQLGQTIAGARVNEALAELGIDPDNIKSVEEQERAVRDLRQELTEANRMYEFAIASLNEYNSRMFKSSEQTRQFEQEVFAAQYTIESLKDIIKQIENTTFGQQIRELGAIESVLSKIDALEKERPGASMERLGQINQELVLLRHQLKELDRVGLQRQKENVILAEKKDLLQQMQGIQEPQVPSMTLVGTDSDEFNQSLMEMNQALQVTNMLNGAMNSLFSTLAGGGNIFEAFGNYLKQLAARLAAMAATAAILAAISGGSGALAGIIASKFGQGANFKGILAQLLGFGGDREMASGGIAYGPTRALIGEYPGARSNPEVVAPLNKLQGMLGGMGMNGNVTFRIEGNSLVGVLDRANRQRFRTS